MFYDLWWWSNYGEIYGIYIFYFYDILDRELHVCLTRQPTAVSIFHLLSERNFSFFFEILSNFKFDPRIHRNSTWTEVWSEETKYLLKLIIIIMDWFIIFPLLLSHCNRKQWFTPSVWLSNRNAVNRMEKSRDENWYREHFTIVGYFYRKCYYVLDDFVSFVWNMRRSSEVNESRKKASHKWARFSWVNC